MPLNVSGEKKLVLVLGAVLLAIACAVAFFTPDEDVDNQPLSSYSTHSAGAKATVTLIGELGYSLERWNEPPSKLPQESEKLLFILGHPQKPATEQDRAGIKQFLENGGTVLAAGRLSALFLPESRQHFEIPKYGWQQYEAVRPNALNAGVDAIVAPMSTAWECKENDEPLFGKDKVVAVTFPVGKGRVIWLGSQVPLSNAGLKAKGNAEFLSNVLATTAPSRVLWDTYFTEFDEAQQKSSLTSTPVLVAGTQVLLIFGLIVFSHSRRFGPMRPFQAAPSMSQSEFVKTLGSLYRAAKANDIALEIAYTRFAFLVTRRLGLPGNSTAAEIGAALSRILSLPLAEVNGVLMKCDAGRHSQTIKTSEAADLMNKLHEYLVALKVIKD